MAVGEHPLKDLLCPVRGGETVSEIYFLYTGREFEDGYADEEVAVAHTLEELKLKYFNFLEHEGGSIYDNSIKGLDTVTLYYFPFHYRSVIEAWNTEALELGIINPPRPFNPTNDPLLNMYAEFAHERALDTAWTLSAFARKQIAEKKGGKIEWRRIKDTPQPE